MLSRIFAIGHRQRMMLQIALIAFPGIAAEAHESEPDWPTSKQLAQVTPSRGDSIPMARKLVRQLRHQLDAGQLELLDKVNLHLQVMRGVEAGYLGKDRLSPTLKRSQLVDYFRWKTEQELLNFLDSLAASSIIEFDLRTGIPPHLSKKPIDIDEHNNLVLLRVKTGMVRDKVRDKETKEKKLAW